MCPLGLMSKRSMPLKIGARKHAIIEDLPLKGPIGRKSNPIRMPRIQLLVHDYSIRLKAQDGRVDCAPLERWHVTPFRFLASSARSRSDVQREIASKIGVEEFQVSVEYTRELFKSLCSIYSVELTGN